MNKIIRGRYFSSEDIKIINALAEKYYSQGRTFISVEVCKALNWKQPNGWLKDRACRDALRHLSSLGFINLPPSKIKHCYESKRFKKKATYEIDTNPINEINFKNVRFELVKGSKKELIWNYVVGKYHYLGFNVFVGRSLKYLIYAGDRIIAALGWCDPAWSISSRDEILVSHGLSVEEIRLRGVNNGRFLIMPWVNVHNLASHLLSQSINIVCKDWNNYYSIKPLYLETFVDPKKFSGTCYKASNWIMLGESTGFKKIGMTHLNHQSPKYYFIYSVDRQLLRRLRKG